MSITVAKLNAIRADINAALVAVAEKHELRELVAGKFTHGSDHFTFKLDGVVLGGLDADAERYVRYQTALRLPPLNSLVEYGGEQYHTTGLNPLGSKVFATRLSNGRTYTVPLSAVQTSALSA